MLHRLRAMRSWWLDTPRAVRWVVYICLPLGAITIGLGIYGDGHGWWDDRSFLTNLASSFASLLFGVPLALVVLTHLSAMQAAVAERRAAQRRMRAADQAFNDLFYRGFQTEPEHIMQAMRNLEEACGELSHLLSTPSRFEAGEFERRVRKLLDVCGVAPPPAWNYHVARSWAVLDEEVRPIAEAAGLPWMPTGEVLSIGRAVARLTEYPASFRKIRRLAMVAGSLQDTGRTTRLKECVRETRQWAESARKIAALITEKGSLLSTYDSQQARPPVT